jgi:hypothetical protein
VRNGSAILLGSLLVTCWFANITSAVQTKSADDILALQGNEFYRAVGELCGSDGDEARNLSLTDGLEIFSRLLKEKVYERDGDLLVRFLGILCGKVDRQEILSRLAENTLDMPGNRYEKPFMFQSLLEANLRLMLREWKKQPPQKTELPPFTVPADARLKEYRRSCDWLGQNFFWQRIRTGSLCGKARNKLVRRARSFHLS